jgi:hypothetical protein
MFKGTTCFLDLFYLLLYVLQKYRKEVPPFFVHGATILQISLEVIQCNTFYHLLQEIIDTREQRAFVQPPDKPVLFAKVGNTSRGIFSQGYPMKFARGFSILSDPK